MGTERAVLNSKNMSDPRTPKTTDTRNHLDRLQNASATQEIFFFFRLKLKTLLLGFTSPFIPCFCHLASHLYVYLSLYPLYVAWLPIFVVCLCFAASTMENFGCTRCEMRLYWSVCLCGSVCVFVCVCEQLRVVAGLVLEGGPSCCLQVNSFFILHFHPQTKLQNNTIMSVY